MSNGCNVCYLASTEPRWVAETVVRWRVDHPCEKHAAAAVPVSTGRTEESTHWVGDAPTSLHGNGATSFDHTTRDPDKVTCDLCQTLLARVVGGESE